MMLWHACCYCPPLMWSLFKTFLMLLMLLLFAAEWVTGESLRYLGDKTNVTICYKAAEIVDIIKEETDSAWEQIGNIAAERVDSWKNVAKRQSSLLRFNRYLCLLPSIENVGRDR